MIKVTKISNQISLSTNLTEVQKLESGLRGLRNVIEPEDLQNINATVKL